jgi:RHS repeat-associated protein
VNGALTHGWLYSGSSVVAELDGAGNVVSRFFPGGMIKDGEVYAILRDHLGSPRLVVNAETGQLAQRMDFDEFGRVLLDTNPGFQPFGFAGGHYDPDTGLVRFGARDYDPEIGRWTAKDPILFQGGDTNLYGYVFNDPVNAVDPNGLEVRATYNHSTGTVFIYDLDSGRSIKLSATSGLHAMQDWRLTGGPTPPGTYEILAGKDADFYRLDALDSDPRNDTHESTGRNRFRFHKPGLTEGCIAAEDEDDWEAVKKLLESTSRSSVSDRGPWVRNWKPWSWNIEKYGTMVVLPYEPPPIYYQLGNNTMP